MKVCSSVVMKINTAKVIIGLTCCFSSIVIAETVRLLELDWSSQRVLTHVLAEILQSKHVDTEVIAISSTPQWMYLSTGKADIQVEVWEGSMGPNFSLYWAKT